MRRYARVLAVQLRISLASAMAYRANFVLQGLISLFWIVITLVPLIVLYTGRTSVAGWTAPEALIVMAYFMAVRAVIEGMISPSLVELVEKIRSGSFDYVLLKPVDAQVMVSASRYEPWRVMELLGALALVGYAVTRLAQPPTLGAVVLGVVLFATGVLATYALWILCAAAAFWVVRLDNLVYLLGAIFDTARWPVQVFSGAWRFIFTFVVPVAVMTTFPAMALLGRLGPTQALGTVGGALALLVVSRLVWRTAIRSYTSASS
jgi:ABC-2 type transport system permease protein